MVFFLGQARQRVLELEGLAPKKPLNEISKIPLAIF